MINIAEILKDAPRGLKLYSLVYGEVTLKEVCTEQEYYSIDIITKKRDILKNFTNDGKLYHSYKDAECVLFPSKEHKSWDNWQDILFQCGDVVVSKNKTLVGLQTFLCYEKDDSGYLAYGIDGEKNYITPSYYRYATQEEREQFFKKLNDNAYTWNENTKQMEKSQQNTHEHDCVGCIDTKTKEEQFNIDYLKPTQFVLVREWNDEKWNLDIFSYINESNGFVCVGEIYGMCIPYNDETKHLLGNTDDCPDKYKTW